MVLPVPRGGKTAQNIELETHGRDRMDNQHDVKENGASACPTPKIHTERNDIFKYGNDRRCCCKEHTQEDRVPQILPPLIALKIFGSVVKIRLGPCPGSLERKHAGKMIIPRSQRRYQDRNTDCLPCQPRFLSIWLPKRSHWLQSQDSAYRRTVPWLHRRLPNTPKLLSPCRSPAVNRTVNSLSCIRKCVAERVLLKPIISSWQQDHHHLCRIFSTPF